MAERNLKKGCRVMAEEGPLEEGMHGGKKGLRNKRWENRTLRRRDVRKETQEEGMKRDGRKTASGRRDAEGC